MSSFIGLNGADRVVGGKPLGGIDCQHLSSLPRSGYGCVYRPTSAFAKENLRLGVLANSGPLGRIRYQTSLREASQSGRLSLGDLGSCSVNSLRERLARDGYVHIHGGVPEFVGSQSNTVTEVLREAHAPRGRPPYDTIYIRWQRQPGADNAPSSSGSAASTWLLTDAKNCDQAKVKDIQSYHPLFHSLFRTAEHFFDGLDQQLKAAFPDHELCVTQEVRYCDPLNNGMVADTGWHVDQSPTFLTATMSWVGPGTIYQPEREVAAPKKAKDDCSLLKDVPGAVTPPGTTLAFYGESGVARPLCHKSPETDAPRLLLIYRLSEAADSARIRSAL